MQLISMLKGTRFAPSSLNQLDHTLLYAHTQGHYISIDCPLLQSVLIAQETLI